MPLVAPNPIPRPSRQHGPELAASRGLTVIEGSRLRELVCVAVSDLDGLHVEHVVARAERLAFTTKVRVLVGLALEHMAAGDIDAAHSHFKALLLLTGQESTRALAMANCCSARLRRSRATSTSAVVARTS